VETITAGRSRTVTITESPRCLYFPSKLS
jgi:hypothetical protein